VSSTPNPGKQHEASTATSCPNPPTCSGRILCPDPRRRVRAGHRSYLACPRRRHGRPTGCARNRNTQAT
jgi:hypothetical protein